MFQKPAVLSLLLSIAIAVMITVSLALFGNLVGRALVLGFGVSFAVGFVVLYPALEFFFYRDIENIRQFVESLDQQESKGEEETKNPARPLERMEHDLRGWAQRKQQEIESLRKLEAFRKDFIADVSHELKTPIFAAQGFVHTLLDGAVKDKSVRKKFLKKAAKSLDGLDVLVQDLLTLSHIETGQIKMRFDNVDLYALTEEVFDQFRGKSNKKEISLRIEGPVRKVMVYADARRIAQVMTNLISNAIKHSGEEGEVVVSFGLRKRYVVTRVTDFGEGIPKEHIGRIFERFYRVDKSRSREKGGTGLGLAIVKHILEGHHTTPEVESEPGKGSTFSFRLSRVKAEKHGNGESADRAKS